MNWYLQLELRLDLRCRLPVPSVYVPNIYISWHWDPDALARWNLVMSYLGLVSKAGRPCAEANAEQLGAQVSCGMKNGKVASLE